MVSPLSNANILSCVLPAAVPKPHLKAGGTGGGLSTYMHPKKHTHTRAVCVALWAHIACEALVSKSKNGGLHSVVIVNQEPVKGKKKTHRWKCCCGFLSLQQHTQKDLQLHPKCENILRQWRSWWGKAQEENTCPKMLQGVQHNQEWSRVENRAGKQKEGGGIRGKEKRKGHKETGLHNILFSWIRILYTKVGNTLSKQLVEKYEGWCGSAWVGVFSIEKHFLCMWAHLSQHHFKKDNTHPVLTTTIYTYSTTAAAICFVFFIILHIIL